MPETHPLQAGDPQTLGSYRLLGRLGKGAQGIVFEGEAPDGRLVAIKLLNTRLDKPGLDSERFMREVAAARRVAQFCTAQVLDANMDGEQPYIVSELVEGVSLQVVVQREGPRAGGVLYRLAVGTVTALAAIHRAGIVHRDFKPSNVLIGGDGPRVIDFGIARALDSAMTISSGVVGTPAYMSPEQISAERVGAPSDMFSWALTMLYAATGRPAFGQDSLPAVIYRVMNEEPDLSVLPDDLRPIVQACLSKRAEDRPTAAEVLFALLENQGKAGQHDDEEALTTGSQLAAAQTPPPASGPAAAPPGSGWVSPQGEPPGAPGWAAPEGRPPAPAASGWANPSGGAYPPPQAPAGGYPASPPYVPPQPPAPAPQYLPPPYPMNAPPYQGTPGRPGTPPAAGHAGSPGRAPAPGRASMLGPGQGHEGWSRTPGSEQGGPVDNDAFFKHSPIEERPDAAKARRRRAALVASTLVVALTLAGGVLYFGPRMLGTTPGKANLAQATTSATPTPPPTPTPTVVTVTPTPTPVQEQPRQQTVPALGKQDGKSLKGHTKGVQTLSAVAMGGKTWLVTGGQDGRVRLWDLAKHKSLATLKGHSEEVYGVAAAMMGKTPIAVSGGYDGSVRLWNLKTRKGKVLGWHGNAVYAVAVTKVKGKWIAVTGDANGYLRFWDLKKRKATGKLVRAHRRPVNWLSATHLGDRAIAISASEDESVRMWDMAKRKAYGKAYKGHSKGVYAVTVGKVDGKTVVASGGKDGKIRIWDPKNGKTIGTMSGHKKIIYSLSFGSVADRTVLLSGSTDGTIRLWDPETRKSLGKPVKAHKSGVYAVGIVPVDDHPAIVTAGKDKLIRMWRVSDS
ncbi:protein kinase domain-containing protein [Nonomuraea sp. H19]|uniref:protein kinase domain-containing protein n=1 Tax=Nonomuraea sp. H19 TaxID=3452206 RepID=UPI003F8B416E